MALTKEGIDEVTSVLNTAVRNIDHLNYEKQYPGTEKSSQTIAGEKMSAMQATSDYAAWVSGTTFGASFDEKYNALNAIGRELSEQALLLCEKLKKFTEEQSNINEGLK